MCLYSLVALIPPSLVLINLSAQGWSASNGLFQAFAGHASALSARTSIEHLSLLPR